MVNIKLDDLEVISLISACNTAVTYYDDLISSATTVGGKTPFANEVIGDFIDAKKKYEGLAKKLGAALLRKDDGLC